MIAATDHAMKELYTRSVDFGDARQVCTDSRPLFCFGLSTVQCVHYIDKDNDFFFSFLNMLRRARFRPQIKSRQRETLPIEPKLPSLYN